MHSSPACVRSLVLFVGIVLALLLPGCGGSERLTPVSGKITFGNEPLSMGQVTFKPDASKGNKAADSAFGTVDTDGTYKLTYKGKPGAPPGWYKVAVSPSGMPKEMPPMGQPMPKPPAINPKFADPEKSGITIEVVASPAAGAYDLKVTK